MTTARVEYRDYVPYEWISFRFCDVKFYGDEADRFDAKWREIRYGRLRKNMPKIDYAYNQIHEDKEELDAVERRLKEIKRWWRFWGSAEERELKQKQKQLVRRIREAKEKAKSLGTDSLYKIRELVDKLEKFLNENGFVLTSTDSRGECVVHTDLWTKD